MQRDEARATVSLCRRTAGPPGVPPPTIERTLARPLIRRRSPVMDAQQTVDPAERHCRIRKCKRTTVQAATLTGPGLRRGAERETRPTRCADGPSSEGTAT